MRVALLLICALGSAWSGDAPPGPAPPAGEADALDRGEPPKPGQASPVAAVPPCAFRFFWGDPGDEYVSVAVIGGGVGMVRPAWVATWKRGKPDLPDEFQVAYRATAFRDERGRVHVDARRAAVAGPASERWSPDSFAFGHRKLWTLDDREDGHAADLAEVIPAATRGDDYRKLLRQVEALAEGGL